MKKKLAFLCLAVLSCTGQSVAGPINYNYLELGYLDYSQDFSGIDDDGNGYEFNASLGLTETVAAVVGYQDLEFESRVDASLTNLGIAYHKPYSATGEVVLGLAYLDYQASPPVGASVDETGNEISLEVRGRTSAKNEVHLGLIRREIGDESNSGYLIRIVTGHPQGFQFVIDYKDIDYAKGWMLGLRSTF